MKKHIKFLFAGLLPLFNRAFAQTPSDFIVPSSSREHFTSRGERAFHTNYIIYKGSWKFRSLDSPFADIFSPGPATTTIPGYHPADILAAYKIPSNGGAEAIAVVDAYDLPTNLSDFNTFSSEFGLPLETSTNPTAATNKVLQVVYPTGTKPAANSSWDGEIALDVEWAHAIAPNAKIYLVECASDAVNVLLQGAQYVASTYSDVRVVSMSFGASEFSGELSYDAMFDQPNVTYVAAAGDQPNVPTYPAVSPDVISVGGTTLELTSGVVASETYWNTDKNDGGSSGPSKFEPRPSYQNSVESIVGQFKGNPDVAAVSNPQTGCSVYVSTPVPGSNGQPEKGWLVFGGTSLACPIVAALENDRGNFANNGFNAVAKLYSLGGTSAFRDIVVGNSGEYPTLVGYDLCTGLGAPLGATVSFTLAYSSGSLVTGVATSGVPGNMALKDNHLYLVRSSVLAGNEVATIQANFTGSVSGSAATAGVLSVTGVSTASTTQVLALNLSTNQFDVIGTVPLDSTESTATISIPNISRYINSSGKISIQISSIGSGTTTQVRLGIDQLAMSVGESA